MKTMKKMEYVSPALEVVLVELEEGIAQASGVTGPAATPSSTGWGDGPGDSWNGEAQ